MPPLTVSAVLSDAWDVYRLLFRRSIPIAVVLYVLIDAVDPIDSVLDNEGLHIALILVGVVLFVAGPVLVHGALVKIVQSVHEGNRPESARRLVADAWQSLASLVGASLLYALGVLIGLLLLIVPGLLAAARWALMAPALMLEGRLTLEAQARSRRIVCGEIDNGLGDRTRLALGIVVTTFLVSSALSATVAFVVRPRIGDAAGWLLGLAVGALVAPFQAHVLSVLYYRLVDPRRPAVDSQVWTWPSVWDGVPGSA